MTGGSRLLAAIRMPRVPNDEGSAPAMRRAAGLAMAVAVAFVLALLLQRAGGAWQGDIDGADEAGHYVTALMFRDYFAAGLRDSPLAFATGFEAQYPRVSIGHWPPVLYTVAGAWMLVFGDSPGAALVFIALLAALTAALLWASVRPLTGSPAAALLAAAFLLLPCTRAYTGMFMAEIPLALLCTAGALAWERTLRAPALRPALLFGIVATAAILIKANGMLLLLVPPLTIVALRRWDFRRRPGVLAAAVGLPAVLGAMWYAVMFEYALRGWPNRIGRPVHPLRTPLFQPRALADIAGPLFTGLAIVGVVAVLAGLARRREGSERAACMLAVCAAAVVFHGIVAPTGEQRHLLVVTPAFLWLAARGTAALPLRRPRVTGALLAGAGAALALFTAASLPPKQRYGARDIAEHLARNGLTSEPLLVASGCTGEGSVIAELAALRRAAPARVVRLTRLAATRTHMGYREKFTTGRELLDGLLASGAAVLVVDDRRCGDGPVLPLFRTTAALVRQHPEHFRPLPGPPALVAEPFRLYRISPVPAGKSGGR